MATNFVLTLNEQAIRAVNRVILFAAVGLLGTTLIASAQTNPPVFVVQPVSQTNLIGTTATFIAVVTGGAPFSYQWLKDGLFLTNSTTIVGANSNVLSVRGVRSSDAGDYWLQVIGGDGASPATSDDVTLTPTNLIVISNALFTAISPAPTGISGDNILVAGGIYNIANGIYTPLTNIPGQFVGISDNTVVSQNSVNLGPVYNGAGGIIYDAYTSLGSLYDLSGMSRNPPGVGYLPPPPNQLYYYGPYLNVRGVSGDEVIGVYEYMVPSGAQQVSFLPIYPFVYIGTNYTFFTNASGPFFSPEIVAGNLLIGRYTGKSGQYIYNSAEALPTPGTISGLDDGGKLVGSYYTGSNGMGFLSSVSNGASYTTFRIPGSTNTSITGGSGPTVVGSYFTPNGGAGFVTRFSLPPQITVQPSNQISCDGAPVTFTCTAAGLAVPLTFEWYKNGELVGEFSGGLDSPATSTLTVTGDSYADYWVLVSNDYGSVQSGVVTFIPAQTPQMSSQPQSRTNLFDANVSFSVAANGTELSYQWYKRDLCTQDFEPIEGETNSALTVSNAWFGDDTVYYVVATNGCGIAISDPATNVFQATRITTVTATASSWVASPDYLPSYLADGAFDDLGGLVNVNGTWESTSIDPNPIAIFNLNGQFRLKTIKVWNNIPFYPATNVTVELRGTDYQCGVDNEVISFPAALNISGLTEISIPDDALLAVTTVILRFDSSPVGVQEVAFFGYGDTNTCIAPKLTVQPGPVSEVVTQGGIASFSARFGGTPALTYVWRHDREEIPPVNSDGVGNVIGSSIVLSNVQPEAAGIYDLVLANDCGMATSRRVYLTVLTPPRIIAEPPQVQIVAGAGTVTLAVATDTNAGCPLLFQWTLNGVNLTNGPNVTGANSNILVISNVQAANTGGYQLHVTSTCGASVDSGVYTLATPPTITGQPRGAIVPLGGVATFAVTASGSGPLSYQWRRSATNLWDAGNVSGANTSSLTVSDARTFDAGRYDVVVISPYGIATSASADLAVVPPPANVAAGASHSLIFGSDGSLWAMGYNGYGQLGDGTTSSTNRPEQVVASGVTVIAAGGNHSLFLRSDGSLRAMGYNGNGQLGDGTSIYYTNQPEQIVASNVTAIAAGGNHSLFLRSDGSLWAMGYNSYGQLGDGTFIYYTNQPEQIVASNVTAVAAGANHSLFLRSDGSLWAMGYNDNGQLGDGTFIYYTNQPEQIVASNVTAIAAGYEHSLFLRSDGSLWAMGYNGYGQLGDGTTSSTNRPEQIVASGVTTITAGAYHSLFLKSDGSLWVMGHNGYGQLGDGTTSSTNRPEQIVASGVIAIAAGAYHSLFLKSDGSLWAMGYNSYGQLGDGTFSNTNRPERIIAASPVGASKLEAPLLTPAGFSFNIHASPNSSYAVLVSTNLFDWSTQRVILVPASGITNILDAIAPNASNRFYRAQKQ